MFELDLNDNPYLCKYSNNGGNLLLASIKGHLSLMEWKNKNLLFEIDLKDKVNDVTFLNTQNMLAIA